MNVYELKSKHEAKHPDSHFFDEETLKFFGETFSKMNVLKKKVDVKDYLGNVHSCYVLSALQRNHPGGPRRVCHYFDSETFDTVIDGEVSF